MGNKAYHKFHPEEAKLRVAYRKGNSGHKHTDETKNKLSEMRKEYNPWKGQKHSKETKEKWVLYRSGENSSNWRGGKSFEVYGAEFNRVLKAKVRSLYSFKCVECGYNKHIFIFLISM